MNKTFQKKGAVEMSLNLIIMLIIGMVVLGLVIGFVNSLVSQGVSGFETQIGENEQLKLDKVKSSAENLAVEPQPRAEIKVGETSNIFIKARAFADELDCGAGKLADAGCELTYVVLDADGSDAGEALFLTGPPLKAATGSEDAQMYTLKTGDGVAVGTYYLTLSLYKDSDNELEKTLTVNVK